MTDIRSLLQNSQKLQSFGQALHLISNNQDSKVVSSDITSSVRHLNQTVDRKVVDLYKNILNNFNKTILPIESTQAKMSNNHLIVENRKQEHPALLGEYGREMVSLRRKKQLERRGKSGLEERGDAKDGKENRREEEGEVVGGGGVAVTRVRMWPGEEKKVFVEYREERGNRAQSPVLPRIHKNGWSPRGKHEIHSAKNMKSTTLQRHKEENYSSKQLFNEKALLDKLSCVTFEIKDHQIDDSTLEFLDFQRQNHDIWDKLSSTISKILQFSQIHNLPKSRVQAKKIVLLAKSRPPFKQSDYLNCFENVDKILEECTSKKLRFYGKVGKVRAVIKIQSWLRMKKQQIQYNKMQDILKKIKLIQTMWKCYLKLKNTRETIRNNMLKLIERFEERQAVFKKNWEQIKLEKRVEIHINSLSMAEIKRLTTEKFLQKENCQLSRIFKLLDPNVNIIYVCPFALSPEVIAYYNKALEISQIYDARNRLMFVWPQVSFSDHSCLCQNSVYSPLMLRRIKSLIRHKTAYLVPGAPSNTYLKLADLLNLPIYGGLPNKAQYFSSKTGCRMLTQRLLPSEVNIYSMEQMLKAFTELIVKNPQTNRWIFKIDDEKGSRGNAYIDVKNMKAVKRIKVRKEELKEDSQEYKAVLAEVEAKLPGRLRMVHKNLFNSYEEYITNFLTAGGIIEASPNYPESQMKSSTFIIDIEPTGKWNLLNSYDKILWHMKPIGCHYPSQMPPPMDELQKISRKLYRQGVQGYLSIDYLNASDKYWFIGADCFLNNMSCIYFTANSVSQYCPSLPTQIPKSPTSDLSFLYCPFIIHSGLSTLQIKTFFHLCRLANISFDIVRRIGSIFIFTDSLQSGTIGLMSFCDNKYGLYKYIVNALEFLSNKLETQHGVIDNPRTDYVTFQEVKNTFKTIIRRMEKERTQNTMGDLKD